MTRLLQNCGVFALAFSMSLTPAIAEEKPNAPKEAAKSDAEKKEVVKEPAKKEPVKKDEPKPDKPKAEAPKPDAPKVDAPKVEAPKTEPAKVEPAKPAAPATHVVKKEPFKIDLTLSGVFESKSVVEVPLRPEVWQQFVIVKAVEHGTRVKKGDVLFQFDSKQIDEAIKDVEASRALGDLEYQAAQEQLSMMEETVPMDMEAAERTKKYFDEDVKRYFEVEQPLVKRIVDENLKSFENQLAYENEELRQLEKMYKADDLTEETEEIILKRQRDTIARLQFSLERTKMMREQTLKIVIPREEDQVKNSERISELRVRSARTQFPRLLAQQRLALQKMTRDREKSLDYLKKLKKDRGLMTIKSPIEGIVFYGQAARGNWNMVGPMGQMLAEGSALKPGMVLVSVVAPRPLVVRTTVAEGALSLAKPGIAGKASPVGFGDVSAPAKLESVGLVPLAPGSFDALVSVNLEGAPGSEAIMPGMATAVKLTAYEKKDALTVPASVIQTEEEDDTKKFVYILEGEAKHRKQDVKVGKTTNGKSEITSGLKEGDKVLVNKPG